MSDENKTPETPEPHEDRPQELEVDLTSEEVLQLRLAQSEVTSADLALRLAKSEQQAYANTVAGKYTRAGYKVTNIDWTTGKLKLTAV